MAKCEFSKLENVNDSCGPSLGVERCTSLSGCNKNILSHLSACNVRDLCLSSEKKLILARAGTVIYDVFIYLFAGDRKGVN